MGRIRSLLLLVPVAIASSATVARAAEVEIGASLISATLGVGEDNDFRTVGIPAGGFGILQPSLFASFFLEPHIAIEPQVSLLWFSGSERSNHFLHAGLQVDYVVLGNTRPSPYLFASGGLVDVGGEDNDEQPTSISAGAGYRIPAGERLTFRVDGRFTHFTRDGGDAVSFALSIGGLFGR